MNIIRETLQDYSCSDETLCFSFGQQTVGTDTWDEERLGNLYNLLDQRYFDTKPDPEKLAKRNAIITTPNVIRRFTNSRHFSYADTLDYIETFRRIGNYSYCDLFIDTEWYNDQSYEEPPEDYAFIFNVSVLSKSVYVKIINA